MPEARRREIVSIARKHGVALVEDDVHGLLPPGPSAADLRPRPRAHLLPHEHLEDPRPRAAHRLRARAAAMVPRLTGSLRATTWAVTPLTAAIASLWIRDGTADALLAARREEARARQALARAAARRRGLSTRAGGLLPLAAPARALAGGQPSSPRPARAASS